MVKRIVLTSLLTLVYTASYTQQKQELQSINTTPLSSANSSINLSFEDALQKAYMLSPTAKAAAFNVKAAEFTKRAAWGVHLPQLGVAANYTYMAQDVGHFDFNAQKDKVLDILGTMPIPPQIIGALKQFDLSYTLQKRDFAVVGANLVVPIYTGGKLNAVSNAGKIKFEQAKSEQKQALNTIFTEVAERYWGLALAQNVELLQKQLVSALEVHLSDASQLEANGMIAKGERLFVAMNLSQARAALTSAQGTTNTINSALNGSLSEAMQLKVETTTYNPTTSLFVADYVEPLFYFKQQVADNSLALEQVELIKRLAKELVRAQRADFVPQVAAMGGINIWDYQLSDQIPRWFVGAGIKWSIFDGLQREYKYSAARNQVRRLEEIETKAQIDVQVLVEKLYSELISAREQVKAAQSTIDFAVEYLRIKNEAFKQGMAPASDIMDAELNLSKAHTEKMAAAYKFDIALTNLLALAGQTERFSDYQNSTTSFNITCN